MMRVLSLALAALLAVSACKSSETGPRLRLPADFTRVLIRLLGKADPALRARLVRAMVVTSRRTGMQLPVVSRLLGERVLAVGLTVDAWTKDEDPAGLLVTNPGKAPIRPVMRLTCVTGKALRGKPMVVYIEDGEEVRTELFKRTQERAVTLSPVPAGGRRLYIITTDRTQVSVGVGDSRRLGVRVRLDHQDLIRQLEKKTDPAARRALMRLVAEDDVQERRDLLSSTVVALGLGWDDFTEGADRAGVVVSNPSARPVTHHLLLVNKARPKFLPVTVTARGDGWGRIIRFDQAGKQTLALPRVPAGQRRFFSFTVDKPWVYEGQSWRQLGVQLGLDAAGLLATLRSSGDPALRGEIAAMMLDGSVLGARRAKGGNEDAFLCGFYRDGWTVGSKPGALILVNRGHAAARFEVTLGCDAGEAYLPVTARVENGQRTQTVRFDRAGSRKLLLDPVAPYTRRLLLVDTDHTWSPAKGADQRELGVRVVSVRRIKAAK